MKLTNQELYCVEGGAIRWSAALGTLVLKAYSYIADLGRYLGSSISYLVRGKRC